MLEMFISILYVRVYAACTHTAYVKYLYYILDLLLTQERATRAFATGYGGDT